MAANIPKTPNVNVGQELVDGFDAAHAVLAAVIDRGGDHEGALLGFMRSPAISDVIATAYDALVRAEALGIPGLSRKEAQQAIAAILHTVIGQELRKRPKTVFEMIELAHAVSLNMVRETARVMVLTNATQVDNGRTAEWDALATAAWLELKSTSSVAKKGADEAMGRAFDALLVSTPTRLAENYTKDCPPDPGSYLYLEDLETWFATLVSDCVRRAFNETKFSGRIIPLPPDDELRDPDEDDEWDEEGGTRRSGSNPPPGLPGGGIGAEVRSRRQEERERDLRRIASLRELVGTAERVLSEKQRRALVAKLFSAKQNDARAALLLICREAVRDVPREVGNDGELAMLIGSPSASAAQRNYNHGRAALLDYARDAEQRQEWCVILDALLPRRSRGSSRRGGARP